MELVERCRRIELILRLALELLDDDEIRALFAEQPLARARGYDAGTFSFNAADGGRCRALLQPGPVRAILQSGFTDTWRSAPLPSSISSRRSPTRSST